MKRSLLAFIILIITAVSCSCSSPPASLEVSPALVRVVVTRNFGQELRFDKLVQVDAGTSALDALKRVAEVETKHGGGFVSSINGIRSEYGGVNSAKRDWFFYINGIMSNMGALDYVLCAGDVEQWDFHDWSFHTFIPATIGAFPETFRQGFQKKTGPTLIAYSASFKQAAEDLAIQLSQSGVTNVAIRSFGELREKERASSNLILLGMTSDDLITELNRNWRRMGFFSYVEDGTIVTFNAKGEVSGHYAARGGVIQATQNPWNPKGVGAGENVVWMLTGTDRMGVEGALDVLIRRPSEIRYAFAAVVVRDQIAKVP